MPLNIGHTKEFTCLTCKSEKVMTYEECKKHLLDYHNVPLSHNRILRMHIAKKPRHISIYELQFKNRVRIQEVNK